MQSLATFFEDNKPLAYAAVVAAVIVVVSLLFVLYRLLFGRPLRASTGGRNRQPRLGIVDAYDLDRQRQLVLVRRDNVEHLIMIGGPSDVVIESSIVRTQGAALPRDKDSAGPLVGAVTPPAALAQAASQGALQGSLGPAPQTVALPPITRTEPSLATRGEPGAAQRGEPVPQSGRAEPALGPAVPMPSPNVERAPADRAPQRPIAMPDPAAPGGPAPQGDAVPPLRNLPPRSPSLPGRGPAPQPAPAPVPTVPSSNGQTAGPQAAPQPASGQGQPAQGPGPAVQAPGQGSLDRSAARPALPPRPPVQRPPLPPRPSLASALPPRPPRPLPPRTEAPRPAADRPEPTRSEPIRSEAPRPEPVRVETSRVEPVRVEPVRVEPVREGPGPVDHQVEAGGSAPEVQVSRPAEPAVPRPEPRPVPAPPAPKSLETLESLEEEMAKLLGRPAPRRDG